MKIFVSYSSKDRDRVRGLVQDLEEIGHDVWFDQELSGGQLWWDRIMANLRDCDLVIFALSANWLNSYASGLEFDYAMALGKNRLPVTIDSVDYPLLPTKIQALQIVDYRSPDRASVTKLARALTHMPAPAPLPDPLPPAPLAPISEWAEIAQRLQDISLALDDQHAILGRIETMLAEQSEIDRATSLLYRLRNRPDAASDIVQEVDSLMARYGIDLGESAPAQPLRGSSLPGVILGLLVLILVGGVLFGVFRGQGAQGDRSTPTPARPVAVEVSVMPTATSAATATIESLFVPTETLASQNPIAYQTGSYQQVRLALIDPDGREADIITSEAALACNSVWSPDASLLAVTRWRNSGSASDSQGSYSVGFLNLADRVLNEAAAPAPESDEPVSWSPDSSRFAYWCGGGLLCLVSASDGSTETLDVIRQDYTRTRLAWSPDGSQIAYACQNDTENSDICLVSLAEGSVQVLVPGLNDEVSPLWSADGTLLIYASSWDESRPASTGTDSGIYQLNLLTNEVTLLYEGQSEQALDNLYFSGDETWIAFSSGTAYNRDLWAMPLDSGEARLLEDRFTEYPVFHWSPTAVTLLYELKVDGYGEVFSISATGGRPVNLTNNAAIDESPAWSSDGLRIVFVSNRDGQRELYLMNADGSGLTRITESSEDDFDPIWSPG